MSQRGPKRCPKVVPGKLQICSNLGPKGVQKGPGEVPNMIRFGPSLKGLGSNCGPRGAHLGLYKPTHGQPFKKPCKNTLPEAGGSISELKRRKTGPKMLSLPLLRRFGVKTSGRGNADAAIAQPRNTLSAERHRHRIAETPNSSLRVRA